MWDHRLRENYRRGAINVVMVPDHPHEMCVAAGAPGTLIGRQRPADVGLGTPAVMQEDVLVGVVHLRLQETRDTGVLGREHALRGYGRVPSLRSEGGEARGGEKRGRNCVHHASGSTLGLEGRQLLCHEDRLKAYSHARSLNGVLARSPHLLALRVPHSRRWLRGLGPGARRSR
jgi:hypothetical protein